MALPKRQQFDLEGAAEYLSCSTGDVLYFLDQGLLRLAVSTSHVSELVSLRLFDLPLAQQQLLKSLYNPDGIDLHRITVDQNVLEGSVPVTCIYLTHHQRNKIKDTVHALGEPIWIFQDLSGEQITVWQEGRLKGFWLYEEDSWIADTYLSREELGRLASSSSENEEPGTQSVVDTSDKKEVPDLYAYPNLADDVARLMVDKMNQFIRENRRIASEAELRDFVVEQEPYISYDHQDKQLEIGEAQDRPTYLAFRSFKQRYQSYFGPK
ncbi:hypothetical protein N8254_05290 [Pseudomonadales bacterium]|nr:hypothetical protein [Pseudomonadales bacterium]